MNSKSSQAEDASPGPLAGIRVLEMCSTIAGPVCARLFADFGAEVIKIEPPGGDPVRNMGKHDGDVSLYAASILRNKRLISVDIKKEAGRDIVKALAAQADILIENYRPGTLERLGLGYDELSKANPRLIMVRISGYGQTGPYSDRPGYGAICEAIAGVRHLTGDPDRPPARVALAVTDEHTAVFAAFGALMAVIYRERTGRGQVIDAALYESAFSMMEMMVPAYDRLKFIPKRVGPNLPSTAPNSLYPTKDGKYVLIAANNDAIFRRLATVMGCPEMADDERYATQRARAARIEEMDEIVAAWSSRHGGEAIERMLLDASVPVSRVYTVEDIFADPHFRDRDMLVKMPHPELGEVTITGIVPKLSDSPGHIRHVGGALGEHTREVLSGVLSLSESRIRDLEAQGVIKSRAQTESPAFVAGRRNPK